MLRQTLRPLVRCASTTTSIATRRVQSTSSMAAAEKAKALSFSAADDLDADLDADLDESGPVRELPRSLQALYLKPLKREAEHGIPSCDLQIRSFSLQPLEFFSDFALRAAYYLGLPAFGPVPLPRMVQRWTVPKSHFIFKKAQENFERRTYRRLIQIKDGHPETVQLWLAYLRKHQYYGIGMKANMWEFSELGVGKEMEALNEKVETLESAFSHLGQVKSIGTQKKVEELLASRKFQETVGLVEPPARLREAQSTN